MSEQPMDETRLEEFLDRKEIDRRQFLRRFGRGSLAAAAVAAGSGLIPRLCRPAFATLHPHRVVRVTSPDATSWDWSTGYYFDYVDQSVVKAMVNRGVQRLTDTSSASAAWQEIMSSYVSGDKVVIKINLNNTDSPGDTDNIMDAMVPVIDEVLDGLTQYVSVPQSDILVYDTSRYIPTERIINRSAYPSSVFSTNHGVWDASAQVTFRDPPRQPAYEYSISADLTAAQHLINIPILKKHAPGVTGAMKNHYGSVRYPTELHVDMANNSYIGDVNNNTHIRDKTRLIICDALFGNYVTNYGQGPSQWQTFDNGSPNTLLFSLDPVATDSVMLDMIQAERTSRGQTTPDPHEFLQVAQDYHGLGIHEHAPYTNIDYIEAELTVTRTDVDNVIRQHKSGEATEAEVTSVIDQYMSGE